MEFIMKDEDSLLGNLRKDYLPVLPKILEKIDKTIKYIAGDLVNQASPREKPSKIDRSNRGYFESKIDKSKDKTPKNDNRLSAKASRSKKKAKGVRQYIKKTKRNNK